MTAVLSQGGGGLTPPAGTGPRTVALEAGPGRADRERYQAESQSENKVIGVLSADPERS